MPSLRPKELCPLHGRRDCCGRAEFVRYSQPQHAIKFAQVAPGIRRYPDGREVCSKAVLRRRKNELIKKHPFCEVCAQKFTEYDDVELGHRESKGIGGARRDDRLSNLCLLHKSSNRAMGSMSVSDYIARGGAC